MSRWSGIKDDGGWSQEEPTGREPYPRLGADPLVVVREARDSLDRVLAKAAKRATARKK